MVPKVTTDFDPLRQVYLANMHRISEGWLAVLSKSKTGSQSTQLRVLLPALDDFPQLCPVRAVNLLISVMDPKLDGPLFIYRRRRLLLYKDVRSVIRAWAAFNGISLTKYGSHSARSGSATTAFKAGVGAAAIMKLGDWLSSAFLNYLRPDVVDLLKTQLAMLQQLKAQLQMC